MTKLNNNKIIFLIAIPLMVSAFVLMFLNLSVTARSAKAQSSCYPIKHTESETIYSQVNCADCNCVDVGDKLFSMFGLDANCEDKKTEKERAECYYNYSYANYSCSELSGDKYEDCIKKYPLPNYKYYQGGAGSFVTRAGLVSGGNRTYFNGFDSMYQHKLMSGFSGSQNEVIIFHETSPDLKFMGSVSIGSSLDQNVIFVAKSSGLYFTENIEFGNKEYKIKKEEEGIMEDYSFDGIGVLGEANRKTGFELSQNEEKIQHLFLKANGNNLIKFNDIKNTSISIDGGDGGRPITEILSGIQIGADDSARGNLNADLLIKGNATLMGKKLLWSKPMDDNLNRILYMEF